jgi:hypothetical protein
LNEHRFNQNAPDEPVMVPAQAMFSVPYPRDKKFVGRQSVIDEVEDRLRTEYCVSLHGVGGIGYGLQSSGSAKTSTNI